MWLIVFLASSVSSTIQTNRLQKISETYSNWALGNPKPVRRYLHNIARDPQETSTTLAPPVLRNPMNFCSNGFCGDECCPMVQTIQAQALPGSPSPPHTMVFVVHPTAQCSPECFPECRPGCTQRMMQQFVQPHCRPDCMPGCHVDCLIIPPIRVRCPTFKCRCAAGYSQCAPFTCCVRYPSMVARMKSNVLEEQEEEKKDKLKMRSPARYSVRIEAPKKMDEGVPVMAPIYFATNQSTTSTTTAIPIIPSKEVLRLPPLGDLKGRHVIRSEHFLDILAQLAQVNLKENIGEDLKKATEFIEFLADHV